MNWNLLPICYYCEAKPGEPCHTLKSHRIMTIGHVWRQPIYVEFKQLTEIIEFIQSNTNEDLSILLPFINRIKLAIKRNQAKQTPS
jgi:predicted house-cleaning noncanonical NTP pyrophosphatase (MazG superfamily)